jgi:hypothetical protein
MRLLTCRRISSGITLQGSTSSPRETFLPSRSPTTMMPEAERELHCIGQVALKTPIGDEGEYAREGVHRTIWRIPMLSSPLFRSGQSKTMLIDILKE